MSLAPRYRWVVSSAVSAPGEDLLTRILRSRGLRDPEQIQSFLDPLSAPPLSAFDVPGTHSAVALLRWAIRRDQRIIVHGDYDADGLSATALMVKGLRALGAQVTPYIPNRLDTGYGLDAMSVMELATQGDVLVTVDCGIRSLEEVRLARQHGMSVIVTDHHLPGQELPQANAVVSTRLPDSPIRDELTGVGIAYQLLRALYAVEGRFGDELEDGASGPAWLEQEVVDLVALGTIADVAPLVGENRRLVRLGLDKMRRDPTLGIAELARVAGVQAERINAWTVAFTLAPRINAAGRQGSSLPALELLLTASPARAAELAQYLERLNRERQRQVKRCLELAKAERSRSADDAPLIFSAAEDYPQGIVGLVAGRLCEDFGLPSIAVCLEDGRAHGSVRSPEWFNANQALESCATLLDKFGGHAQAAGFSCPTAVVPEVERHLKDLARALATERDPRPTLEVDAETPLVTAGQPIWEQLEALEPTGCGNPRPVFVSRGVRIASKSLMGRDGSHLQVVLQDDWGEIRAVGFGFGPICPRLGDRADIAYHLDEHAYNGTVERRLQIIDLADPSQPE
jgi:single-stranded-DNA-specific exonuclease